MLAADLEGTRLPLRDTPEYVVQVQDSHLGFPAGRLQVYEFHVDWDSPSSSTLVPTASLVPQPFTPTRATMSLSVSSSRELSDSIRFLMAT